MHHRRPPPRRARERWEGDCGAKLISPLAYVHKAIEENRASRPQQGPIALSVARKHAATLSASGAKRYCWAILVIRLIKRNGNLKTLISEKPQQALAFQPCCIAFRASRKPLPRQSGFRVEPLRTAISRAVQCSRLRKLFSIVAAGDYRWTVVMGPDHQPIRLRDDAFEQQKWIRHVI